MSWLLTIAAAYAGFCALLFFTQRSQMYFPVPARPHAPAPELTVRSGDETIRVWAVNRGPGSPALVYFGGNAEDVGWSVDEFSRLLPEHSLYLVNYRGYGGSSGRPTQQGIYADAAAVYDAVRAGHGRIDAMGRSLGSAVALHLASVRDVDRLVLVEPFDSLVGVAQHHFRWLPVSWLMLDRYEVAAAAATLDTPSLVVIAAEDEIIPRARSEALVTALRPRPEVVVIDGASHNTLDLSPDYLRSVQRFLRAPSHGLK